MEITCVYLIWEKTRALIEEEYLTEILKRNTKSVNGDIKMEWKLSRKTQQRFRHFRVWKDFEQLDVKPENFKCAASKKSACAAGLLRPSISTMY
jgi:hypothetical protein